MEEVPWKRVFNWIMDNTHKQIIAPWIPTGTFTFVAPKGVRLTVPQIVELIKTVLREQANALLIERPRNFVLVPADEKIDPS